MTRLFNSQFFEVKKETRKLLDIRDICETFGLNPDSAKLLYDEDAKKTEDSPSKLLKAIDSSGLAVKIRIYTSQEIMNRSFLSTELVYNSGVPVCRPLNMNTTTASFQYMEGKRVTYISDYMIHKTGEIHSNLNSVKIENGGFDSRRFFEQLIKEGLEYLVKNQWKAVTRNFIHKTFNLEIPTLPLVLDHDDFGVHNVIRNKKDLVLIDEEAFGVLPFGLGLIRPLYDLYYGFCRTQQQRRRYLGKFDSNLQQVFRENERFLLFIYTFRNSIRKFTHNNRAGGLKMLKKAESLP